MQGKRHEAGGSASDADGHAGVAGETGPSRQAVAGMGLSLVPYEEGASVNQQPARSRFAAEAEVPIQQANVQVIPPPPTPYTQFSA